MQAANPKPVSAYSSVMMGAVVALGLGCAPATGGPVGVDTTPRPRTSTQQHTPTATVGLQARLGTPRSDDSVELVATVIEPDGRVSTRSLGRQLGRVDRSVPRAGDHEPIVIERDDGTVVVWVVMSDDGYVELRQRAPDAAASDHVVLRRVSLDEFEVAPADAEDTEADDPAGD